MANHAQRDNLEYIESLYQQFRSNPSSVSSDWQLFFDGMEFGIGPAAGKGLNEKELDVYHLINAYRNFGHFEADTDPLTHKPSSSDQLSLGQFNLTEKDLEQKFQAGKIIGKPNSTLKEIIQHLRQIYCGHLTIQAGDCLPQVRNWFIKEFESSKDAFKITADRKKNILKSLTKAETLEKFIHTRYVGAKRFSVEGGDSVLPMLDALVEKGSELGIQEVILGMAHRGRVNVLTNFMGKKENSIFADFNGPTETAAPIEDFDGDVKYHLGYKTVKNVNGKDCQVSLAFNPSHLEAVNPVVLGMARAAQRRRKDIQQRKCVVPVLIHGDAAFAGQGIGLETFQMSQVKGYKVGGTIHIVIDNQVGFTTNPENSRSSHYCSDTAKIISTPVLHVNGNDVEACVRATEIAVRYRQEWGRDVVINVVCYRRFGHNEGDEPAYTQPLMYELIKKQPTTRDLYARTLAREGVIDIAFADSLVTERMDYLQQVFEDTKKSPPKIELYKFEGPWKGLRKFTAKDAESEVNTKVDKKVLQKIGKLLGELPAGFNLHPKLTKLVESRKNMAEGKDLIDWGSAELFAYGSLLEEGHSVRLTGQDCIRGTFTHRHAGFYDVKTNEGYIPLKKLNPDKTEFCVYDSVLSEYGVLGFEYGNSIYDPQFLTIWEAQFGDFANGAQIIIDQFISAAESKWQQMSGLVLLLPHGFEGQGPEHSSARLERFLQLCAQNNMQVMNLTTPAQIYHALRRQVRRDFRKPMINMSPKSLLRHPKAVSTIDELANGTFQELILDATVDAKKVEKIVMVSGKLYYELLEEKEKQKDTKTALVRLEQIYPTPAKKIAEMFKTYSKAKTLVWAQEEPKNMGAWGHICFKLQEIMDANKVGLKLKYVGRDERSSPAVGSPYRHKVEQAAIINQVFEA